MTRVERLAALMEEFPPSDPASADVDEPGDWALVEFNSRSDEWWITIHESQWDAGSYSVGQEDPSWVPELLVNLNDGLQYEPVLQPPTWQPKRT